MRPKLGLIKILNAAAANGAGSAIDISNYSHVVLQLATSGSAAATIKLAVSMSLLKPDFSASPSTTNIYDFIEITPLNNQATPLPGSTGIVLTGTDVKKLYEVDASYIKWICPIVSGYSAGALNLEIDAANNYSRG